ncbi:hypothetical protein LEP1GSC132_1285 [Leptospira kirschneri str. 200803703]|uniref:Uncharacterized protein n=3 Tax=Leptospira kirschneri TaxID=29507 RepID=A0A0E2AZ71_9LEPT|nr:hypothetical protein LEP1GSC044_1235 [Leptospira kirschneri serovar Grippotyphosa str. RM52]EKO14233.1 hypothetical protein LEP1GSC081_0786 [Leptospira kirschneri str. H1]EKO52600.1 hypothetical protein LEP1GSC131_4341 [Leptospira kirschneri str. 200802841]EKO60271.1 hypothetical protein LEP1GSC082_2616 [Leptospira kirschneri str. H2]EKP03384.1 hypothetical protein LEP1GSC018_3790 [Leptospira kirschneri str. 2008720114]EKQ83045.1 hypothetical protein LEP1GSC064_3265 [Leptospira kirschneri s
MESIRNIAVSFILQFYNEKESYKLNLEIGYGMSNLSKN